jgi:hypothetical protein
VLISSLSSSRFFVGFAIVGFLSQLVAQSARQLRAEIEAGSQRNHLQENYKGDTFLSKQHQSFPFLAARFFVTFFAPLAFFGLPVGRLATKVRSSSRTNQSRPIRWAGSRSSLMSW